MQISKAAGADFSIKTSTGFSTGGAKVEDVRLMRETVGPEMGVKASGGIHNERRSNGNDEAGATKSEQAARSSNRIWFNWRGRLLIFKRRSFMAELKQEWINTAIEALDKAYVPYSHFPVGACLCNRIRQDLSKVSTSRMHHLD